MSSTYHIHSTVASTGCGFNPISGQHSPVLAIMADGIPLYGEFGDNGVVPTDLDDCGGHVDSK